jgi:5-methylcytosine-specific restriction endonuclease McrA
MMIKKLSRYFFISCFLVEITYIISMKKKRKGYVSPELAETILERANYRCEVCGKGSLTEIHHIVGRKVDANEYNLTLLCWDCHKGTNGIHGMNGKDLDHRLKSELQTKYFELGYKENEIRELMSGKLMLNDEGGIVT